MTGPTCILTAGCLISSRMLVASRCRTSEEEESSHQHWRIDSSPYRWLTDSCHTHPPLLHL